jgi:fructose-specific phosphotransferase system component IIB
MGKINMLTPKQLATIEKVMIDRAIADGDDQNLSKQEIRKNVAQKIKEAKQLIKDINSSIRMNNVLKGKLK